MSIIVEDGTGKTDAESYASVAQADAIISAHGLAANWSALADEAKEAALRAATMWIDASFSHRFSGVRLYETQALEWPRGFAAYARGVSIPSESVPVAVVKACCLAAAEHVSSSAFAASQLVASESVGLGSGAIAKSTTYATPKDTGFRPKAAILALSPVLSALTLERS